MIIFDLACEQNHRFEGWFQSREDFDAQLAGGLIACPHCSSPDVRRVPSAVHLAGLTPLPAALPVPAAPPGHLDVHADGRTALRQLTDMLLAQCEDVGPRFAEEARRMHYTGASERSIRGEASDDEYEALRDEGIEVFRLLRLKPGDLH